jgi:hypothetical protein
MTLPDTFGRVRVWYVPVFVTACSFTPPAFTFDAAVDAPVDVSIDTPTSSRVAGPIAVWTFSETSGMTVADSQTIDPVDLTVAATSMVSPVDGGLRLDARCNIQSAAQPHVNRDVRLSDAVTLEAWVTPSNVTQGETSYTVVAAITANLTNRNISLEQRGNLWAGRTRTSATTIDAEPSIVSTVTVDLARPTHLVLVADGAQRTLYVNGAPATASPTANGTMTTWSADMRFRVGDELNSDRHWLGTLWLVAMYDKALSEAEVNQNFLAGHDCSDC